MVLKCCVDSCYSIKRPNLSFHRFPLGDPERLRQWLLSLDMDVNTPLRLLSKLFVCQKHFQPDDYHSDPPLQPSRRHRTLRTTAVPDRFRHQDEQNPSSRTSSRW
uniref:THAP domain-containing protein 1 n=1 Tax=Stegastes partitus TaxID=144197 RepID=A0A3B5BAK4_9TELE